MTGMVVPTVCPVCQAPVAPEEYYCESCGEELGRAGSPTEDVGAGPDAGSDQSPPARRRVLDSDVVVDSPDLAVSVTVCPACAGPVAADGYCEQCGSPAPRYRDHWAERPADWVAAVCDRGIRHVHNEDGLALAARQEAGGFAALVVCDGVSSSSGSDVASLAAARAARDALARGAAAGGPPGAAAVTRRPVPVSVPVPAAGPAPAPGADPGGDPGADPTVDRGEDRADPFLGGAGAAGPGPTPGRSSGGRADVLASWMVEAAHAAHLEVIAAAGDPPRANPPSCTFVGAVVEDGNVVVGWVGDSRAYWLPDFGTPEQLTVDDSWAAEQMALGASREEAESAPRAHAITRWLGVDAPHPAPRVTVRAPWEPGWLLVCSDGLWNYCSAAEDMHALVSGTVAATGADPAAATAALVDWAIARGGHDNISVALARVGGTRG